MAMNVGSNSGLQATINMTPMIDVLLVLLIIFMAISPQKPRGLDAAVPQAATDHAAPDESQVVVEVASDGSLRINSSAIREEALGERLARIFASRANRVVFLKADSGLEFHGVATVIDAIHSSGIDRVAFVPRTYTR